MRSEAQTHPPDGRRCRKRCDKAKSLLGLRVRSRGGNRTGSCGLLRRGGRAMSAIGSATGDQGKGHDGEAGDDDFFHEGMLV